MTGSNTTTTPTPTQPRANRGARRARARQRSQVAKAEAKVQKQVARQLGQALTARAGQNSPREVSQYLRTLLSPEVYGPTCYPDNFGDRVTLGKFIINGDVEFDAEGNFMVWANPTLGNTVRVSRSANSSTGVGVAYECQNTYPPSAGTSGYTNVRKVPIPNAGVYSDVPFSAPQFAAVASGNDTKEYALTMRDDFAVAMPSGYTAATLTIPTASVGTYGGSATTWQAVFGASGSLTTSAITLGTPLVIPTGLLWVGLRVTAAAKDKLQKVTVQMSITTPADSLWQVSEDVPDYDLLVGDTLDDAEAGQAGTNGGAPIYEEYRPVAMSLLVSFRGNTLYDGGNIAGRVLQGGETPEGLEIYDYATLSRLPDTWDGPLKTGAYLFWKPTDTLDMTFKEPSWENDNGEMPSLIVAGKVTDPANSQVRYRLCICVEAKTSRQLLPTMKSTIDPDEIAAAFRALQQIPAVMENPLHLDKIAAFLKEKVKQAEEFWAKYKRPLMKVASAAKMAGALMF